MNVLGIETSCDETAAAVVAGGRAILSNVVFSQTAIHGPYGGVVPELAARHHLRALPGLIEEARQQTTLGWEGIGAVAATRGPGLAGALLVGLTAGKALALRLGVPFVAVNHLEAHLYSVFLAPGAPAFADACPLAALVVSGGHTALVRAEQPGHYRLLGRTLDDAAGEAFDKGAQLLGLGYPGGPAVERAAAGGDPRGLALPRAPTLDAADTGGLDPALCFSFSGLKTALRYALRARPPADAPDVRDAAASYQEAIVAALERGVGRALDRAPVRTLVAAGGVVLNRRLRDGLQRLADGRGVRLLMPEPACCGDNAAMVAGAAGAGLGLGGAAAWTLDVCPTLSLGDANAS